MAQSAFTVDVDFVLAEVKKALGLAASGGAKQAATSLNAVARALNNVAAAARNVTKAINAITAASKGAAMAQPGLPVRGPGGRFVSPRAIQAAPRGVRGTGGVAAGLIGGGAGGPVMSSLAPGVGIPGLLGMAVLPIAKPLNHVAVAFAQAGGRLERSMGMLGTRLAYIGRVMPANLANLFRGVTGGGGAGGFASAPLRMAGRLAGAAGTVVGRTLSAGVASGAALISISLEKSGQIGRAMLNGLAGLFKEITNIFPKFVGGGVSALTKSFTTVFGNVATVFQKSITAFANLGLSIAQAIAQGLMGGVQVVAGAAEAVLSMLTNLLSGLLELSADLAEKIVNVLVKGITTGLAASLAGALILGVKSAGVDRVFAETLALSPSTAATVAEPLKKAALDAAGSFAIAFDDAFKGLHRTVSQGFKDAAEAAGVFQAATLLSAGASVEFSASVDAVSRAFRLYSDETLNATVVADKFFVGAAIGSANVEDFASNIGKVIGQSRSMNVEFDQLVSTLSVLTNVLKPEQAFTGLTTALSDILDPTEKGAAVLERLGIEYSRANFQLIPFLESLKKAGASAKDIAVVFEQRSARAVNALLPRLGELRKAYDEVGAATGKTVTEAAELVAHSPAGAFQRLQNAVRRAGLELFDITKIRLAEFFEGLIRRVDDLRVRLVRFVESDAFAKMIDFAERGMESLRISFSGLGTAIGAAATGGASAGFEALGRVPVFQDIVAILNEIKATLIDTALNIMEAMFDGLRNLSLNITESLVRLGYAIKDIMSLFFEPLAKTISILPRIQAALSGMSAGAAAGSAIPGLGTAAGAVGGLAAGLIGYDILADKVKKVVSDAADAARELFGRESEKALVAEREAERSVREELRSELSRLFAAGAATPGFAEKRDALLTLIDEATGRIGVLNEALSSYDAVQLAVAKSTGAINDQFVRLADASKGLVGGMLKAKDAAEASAFMARRAATGLRATAAAAPGPSTSLFPLVGGAATSGLPTSPTSTIIDPAVLKAMKEALMTSSERIEAEIADLRDKNETTALAMRDALRTMDTTLKLQLDIARQKLDVFRDMRDKMTNAITLMSNRIANLIGAGNSALSQIAAKLAPKEPKLPHQVEKFLRRRRRAQEREMQEASDAAFRTGGYFGASGVDASYESLARAKMAVAAVKARYAESERLADEAVAAEKAAAEVRTVLIKAEEDARRELVAKYKALSAKISGPKPAGDLTFTDEEAAIAKKAGVAVGPVKMDPKTGEYTATGLKEPAGRALEEISAYLEKIYGGKIDLTGLKGKLDKIDKVEAEAKRGAKPETGAEDLAAAIGEIPTEIISPDQLDAMISAIEDRVKLYEDQRLKLDELLQTNENFVQKTGEFVEQTASVLAVQTDLFKELTTRIANMTKKIEAAEAQIKALESIK